MVCLPEDVQHNIWKVYFHQNVMYELKQMFKITMSIDTNLSWFIVSDINISTLYNLLFQSRNESSEKKVKYILNHLKPYIHQCENKRYTYYEQLLLNEFDTHGYINLYNFLKRFFKQNAQTYKKCTDMYIE
jgi:hypothetical protein